MPDGLYTQGMVLQVAEVSCVVQEFLSSGGKANIYLVTLMKDGSKRVLKHVPLTENADDNREIGFMTQLNGHANIVALDAAEFNAESGAYILMEYCPTDVLTLMNSKLAVSESLDEETILEIFSNVCSAVAHMHYQPQPILHRDLKVENILVGQDGSYKLCDFGSATTHLMTDQRSRQMTRKSIVQLEEEIQHMTTLEYRAPEMVDLYLRRGINEKADIWALGVLLFKLCYFKTPFDNASSLAILNAEYFIPKSPVYSKKLTHIFQMTMSEEPRERSTIYTLLSYVCGMKGVPCPLENIYESPPLSPTTMEQITPQITGQKQPARRFDTTHNKYIGGKPRSIYNGSSRNSSLVDLSTGGHNSPKSGDDFSLSEQSDIVPMRRGRPTPRKNVRMSVSKTPDGRESLSMDFVQGAVFGSAKRTSSIIRRNPSIRSNKSTASVYSVNDTTEKKLPGFVCQPLPPPPKPSSTTGKIAPIKPTKTEKELAAMISPLSLNGNSGVRSPAISSAISEEEEEEDVAKEPSAISIPRPPKQQQQQQQQQRVPVKSIYEMTWDKLESDGPRFSMVFEDNDPMLLGAKGMYAAQRSSIYHDGSNGNYFAGTNGKKLPEWDELPESEMDGMMKKMDEHQQKQRKESIVDIDTVIQRARGRNRDRLVAQNNRRTLYIANNSSDQGLLLPEDVDDNMRVLTEAEIDELLVKMDMYNRELLSEQQRWIQDKPDDKKEGEKAIDEFIEKANDQMLRKEQTGNGSSVLKNVISAAKSTFAKATTVPAEKKEEEAPIASVEKPAAVEEKQSPAPTAPIAVAAEALPTPPLSSTEPAEEKKEKAVTKARSPVLPKFPRSHTTNTSVVNSTVKSKVVDPLAETRARLKQKQSSPVLPTLSTTADSISSRSSRSGASTPTTKTGQAKNVRNLVAMFEKT